MEGARCWQYNYNSEFSQLLTGYCRGRSPFILFGIEPSCPDGGRSPCYLRPRPTRLSDQSEIIVECSNALRDKAQAPGTCLGRAHPPLAAPRAT
jgi:hypothetical protein